MPSTQGLIAHWYYHVPSLLLAAMAGLTLVRFVLQAVASRGSVQPLRSLTEVAVAPVRWMAPQIASETLVLLMAVAWIMAARIVFYLACTAGGLRLSLG